MLLREIEPTHLPAAPRIRYTRKSSEQSDRQVASHDQQYAECDRHFGSVPEEWRDYWFRDDKSGTDFNRPAFKQMVEFCLAHPQVNGSRGRIEVYDHSRWGRPVMKDGQGDIIGSNVKEFDRWVLRLDEAGWDVEFTTAQKSENELANSVTELIEKHIAAQKSVNLSREVKRGVRDWRRKGRWMGGPPPFPAKRVHPTTGQDLPPGTRAFNGGSVLAVDESKLPDWIRAADMVLEGRSLVAVAQDFEHRGVRNYHDGSIRNGRLPRWTGEHIRKILTNPALIGELRIKQRDRAPEVIKAAWGPLVPVELFQAVQRKLESDRAKVRRRSRRGASTYAVPIMCTRCGSQLAGVDVKQPDGTVHRRYRHHSPRSMGLRHDVRDRMVAAGCRTWMVDANEVEDAILELVAAERASPDFKERLGAMLADGTEFADALMRRVGEAKAEVTRIEAQQRETLRLMTVGATRGISEELFLQQLEGLKAEHAAALRAHGEAEETQTAAEAQRATMLELLNETTAVVDRWRNGGVADRRAILDWWVDAVLVEFEETERKPKGTAQKQSSNLGQRSARKRLVVFLASLPTGAVAVQLDPPRRKQTRVGHRAWKPVEVRTTLQAQSSAGSGTSRFPTEWVDSRRNDESKTTGSACCTC
jgi:site-specific DNA recombinase